MRPVVICLFWVKGTIFPLARTYEIYTSSMGLCDEQAMAFTRYSRLSERTAVAGSLLGNVSEYVNIGDPMGVVVGDRVGVGVGVGV